MLKFKYIYALKNPTKLDKILSGVFVTGAITIMSLLSPNYILFFIIGAMIALLFRYEITSPYDLMPLTFLMSFGLIFGPIFGAALISLILLLLIPFISVKREDRKLKDTDESLKLAYLLTVVIKSKDISSKRYRSILKVIKKLKVNLIAKDDYDIIYSWLDGLTRNHSQSYQDNYLRLNRLGLEMFQKYPSRKEEISRSAEKGESADSYSEDYVDELLEKLTY